MRNSASRWSHNWKKVAQIKSDEFFVPPSLWRAGLGGTFVEGLKNKLSPDVESESKRPTSET
jgi:hypothetical protein